MEMSVILAAGRKSEGILGAHGDKSVKKKFTGHIRTRYSAVGSSYLPTLVFSLNYLSFPRNKTQCVIF